MIIDKNVYRRLLLAECELLRVKETVTTLRKVIEKKTKNVKYLQKDLSRYKKLFRNRMNVDGTKTADEETHVKCL